MGRRAAIAPLSPAPVAPAMRRRQRSLRPSRDAVDVLEQHVVALVGSVLPSTAATRRQRLPASGDVRRLVFLLGAAIARRGRPPPQRCDRRRHCARPWATDRSEAWKWSVEALMETAAALSSAAALWPTKVALAFNDRRSSREIHEILCEESHEGPLQPLGGGKGALWAARGTIKTFGHAWWQKRHLSVRNFGGSLPSPLCCRASSPTWFATTT